MPLFGMGQPPARVLRGRSEGGVGGGKQRDVVTAVGGGLPQQGRPAAQLPIPEHLRQELALGLRQKHDAEDAEEGTGRQDHVLQEGPMAHVEALGWATQPAERPQCHDEAQASAPGRDNKALSLRLWASSPPFPSGRSSCIPQSLSSDRGREAALAARLLSPDRGRDDFGSKEGAKDAGSLGGEEPKDREGGDGGLVQIWRDQTRRVSGGGRSCLALSLPSPLLIPSRVCLGFDDQLGEQTGVCGQGEGCERSGQDLVWSWEA